MTSASCFTEHNVCGVGVVLNSGEDKEKAASRYQLLMGDGFHILLQGRSYTRI